MNWKFWQDGSHPVELYTPEFTKQKLNYTIYKYKTAFLFLPHP